ncbi:unnamed protein product, partial [Mesorhabditis spiculigera]
MMWIFYGLLGATAAFSQRDGIGDVPVDVETRLGKIRGREGTFEMKDGSLPKVRTFLSVPFAEPPTGNLRFRPPVPKKPWREAVEAIEPPPACYQGRDNYNTSFWGSEMWNHNTPAKEDCLYLNIWAPADARNLTVMVWLFGGGYYSGSASLILYDGRALAVTGNVVVVNINYRVGPFGYLFFDHTDAPGNMGMLDQQLALQWIRDNIFSFGGNPDRVTLFGESAGASSIVAHLIAPGSQRLFKHGILQSGSLDNKWSMDTPQRARRKSEKLAELVGCNRTTDTATIQCLRDSEPQKLVDVMWNVDLTFLEFPFVIVSRDRHFFRHKDGFQSLRKADFTKGVNLMFGINHDEGAQFLEHLQPARLFQHSNIHDHHNTGNFQDTATIQCLRDSEPQKLVDVMWNVDLTFLEFPFVIVSRDRHFFRHKDGFQSLRKADFTKSVNLMFGINHDEGNFWNIYNLPDYFNVPIQPELTREEFFDCVDKAFAVQPEVIRYATKFVYSDPYCNGTGKRKFYAEQVNQMVGDYFFTCDSIWLADKVAADPTNNAQVYIYYFDQHSSANPWPEWTGVMHGYEIEYVFGVPLYNKTAGYTRREEIFSRKVIDYWTTFATTGVPSVHGSKNHAIWPKYDQTSKSWMNLKAGSNLFAMHAKKSVECDLWRHSKDLEFNNYVHVVSSTREYTISTITILIIGALLF